MKMYLHYVHTTDIQYTINNQIAWSLLKISDFSASQLK